MKHVIDHDLDQETARKATRKAFETYAEKFADYNPTANWTSDDRAEIGFKAKGMKLDGAVELKPNKIELELDVPMLLRPFKKKAMGVIDGEIREWIERAKKGELD